MPRQDVIAIQWRYSTIVPIISIFNGIEKKDGCGWLVATIHSERTKAHRSIKCRQKHAERLKWALWSTAFANERQQNSDNN